MLVKPSGFFLALVLFQSSLLLASCQDSSYRLVLMYPDRQSFEQARLVELLVGERTTCVDL